MTENAVLAKFAGHLILMKSFAVKTFLEGVSIALKTSPSQLILTVSIRACMALPASALHDPVFAENSILGLFASSLRLRVRVLMSMLMVAGLPVIA